MELATGFALEGLRDGVEGMRVCDARTEDVRCGEEDGAGLIVRSCDNRGSLKSVLVLRQFDVDTNSSHTSELSPAST